jgi:hypothetical protein
MAVLPDFMTRSGQEPWPLFWARQNFNDPKRVRQISIRRTFVNLLPRISVQDRSAIPRRIIRWIRVKEIIYGEHREVSESQGSGFGQT